MTNKGHKLDSTATAVKNVAEHSPWRHHLLPARRQGNRSPGYQHSQ
jgi:hypothetical protein